jgi:hypothetical protein
MSEKKLPMGAASQVNGLVGTRNGLLVVREARGNGAYECLCLGCNKGSVVGAGYIKHNSCCYNCGLKIPKRKSKMYTVLSKRHLQMTKSCTDKSSRSYPSLGGRGISVDPSIRNVNAYMALIVNLPGYAEMKSAKDVSVYDVSRIDRDVDFAPGNLRIIHESLKGKAATPESITQAEAPKLAVVDGFGIFLKLTPGGGIKPLEMELAVGPFRKSGKVYYDEEHRCVLEEHYAPTRAEIRKKAKEMAEKHLDDLGRAAKLTRDSLTLFLNDATPRTGAPEGWMVAVNEESGHVVEAPNKDALARLLEVSRSTVYRSLNEKRKLLNGYQVRTAEDYNQSVNDGMGYKVTGLDPE